MKNLYAIALFLSCHFLLLPLCTNPARATEPIQDIVAHRGASAERPECTLPALQRAIEAGATAVEIDIRTSKDGVLFLLHDATLDRTTDGNGLASALTIAELKKLDAGSWFDAKYRDQRIPTLREALELCKGKIDVLLDLKEEGKDYDHFVSQDVLKYGDPKRTILGVRSAQQARRFRKLLPTTQQIGFIPDTEQIDAFAKAGVETIRLWPRWLSDKPDDKFVAQIRKHKLRLHLNGTTGQLSEIFPLLKYKPDSLLVDDPAMLVATLNELVQNSESYSILDDLVASIEGAEVTPGISRVGAITVRNRDYQMQQLPKEFIGQPRYIFDGGSGDRVVMKFKKPTVIFAVFQYNDTGAWSFPDGRSPVDYGWRLLRKDAYRGTSNGNLNNKTHYASIYYCQYNAGQQLSGLPKWWVNLAVMDLARAEEISGFRPGVSGPVKVAPHFSYEQWSTSERPLEAPPFENLEQWTGWQQKHRHKFREQLVFQYENEIKIVAVGDLVNRGKFSQQEFHVASNNQRIFRFYRLAPHVVKKKDVPTIVCFMGHGTVRQILEDRASYQHACAAQFAEQGYLVFAMENVGMEPSRNTHLELDRLLRLDGFSWYSLLFAHQQILLDYIFEDQQVDVKRVGVTGVSTGGLLALSAAAFEPRIAATSVQGIYGSMRISFIHDRNFHCQCGAIPNLLPEFDLPIMALLVTPRPMHISNAAKDGFSPKEAKRCIQLISPLYQKAGGPVPLFSEPPGGHEFAFEPALKFFEKTIEKPE